MGTMHMYEYIILNRMPGVRYLTPSDPNVKLHLKTVEATIESGRKIDLLESKGLLTKTKANEYRKKIVSKRAATVRRVEVMEEVLGIYNGSK